ncbi:MAG: tetratricopeptide repeat protein [Colwellia sp.]|nr:tetratricopeptide repeat protein [Colwellia sp.]
MKKLFSIIGIALLMASSFIYAKEQANLRSVYNMMDNKQYDKAAHKLNSLVEKYPEDADARYQLALALLRLEKYEDSIKVYKKTVELSESYARYAAFDIGLAYAGLGKPKKALNNIKHALHAGYTNFDRLKSEKLLKKISDHQLVEFAPEQHYDTFTAHNNIVLPYKTIMPIDYDKNKTYKGMVAFPPGDYGKASADWLIDKLFNNHQNDEWIITVVLAPENGLINHPAHHALNDLMTHQRDKYKIADNKFHFLGYHNGGSPAATYSQMSSDYVNGLTTIGNYYWENWKDDSLRNFTAKATHLFLGENDKAGIKINQRAHDIFSDAGMLVELKVFEGEGAIITALENGQLYQYLR